MAHELSTREDGMVEMAFIGQRSKIWHGLGQELEENASIETWKKQAGMDWEVFESAAIYQTASGTKTFQEKKILFRSDTDFPLSVVSGDYKIVQPGEVLEFFRDLVGESGMKLSTAGVLFGGKRFWALADTGKTADIVKGDEVYGNILLTTSVDGTLATTAKMVSTRVVCNNTLTVAMREGSKNMVKTTHKSVFDAKLTKLNMGLVDEGWEDFITNLQTLNSIKMTDNDVRSFYQDMFFDKKKDASEQGWGVDRKITQLMELYQNGAGANLAKGTAWGALNGITNMFTHGSGKRDASHQMWDAYYGQSDDTKQDALKKLLELA